LRGNFWPVLSQAIVSIEHSPAAGCSEERPYDDVVDAIQEAAKRRTLESAIEDADAIVLAKTPRASDAKHESFEEDGAVVRRLIKPLEVVRSYRGSEEPHWLVLDLYPARPEVPLAQRQREKEASSVRHSLSTTIKTRRVLVFGRIANDHQLIPVGVGCVAVTDADVVFLPYVRRDTSGFTNATMTLAAFEDMLQ
jgi:hypothetical protein